MANSEPVAPEDQTPFDEFVQQAADLVASGVVTLDEVELKPYHDESRADLVAAVEELLEEDDNGDDGDSEDADPRSVDWAALWDEFGFDTPNAAGHKIVSDTQLRMALEVTDQPLQGDATGHIRSGLTQTELVERRTEGGTLRGYVFVGGDE